MENEKSHLFDVETSNTLVGYFGQKKKANPDHHHNFPNWAHLLGRQLGGPDRSPNHKKKDRPNVALIFHSPWSQFPKKKVKKTIKATKKTQRPHPKRLNGSSRSTNNRPTNRPSRRSSYEKKGGDFERHPKILWDQAKLVNKESLVAQIWRRPAKIASLMFDVLPRADVHAIATEMSMHCATDILEEVLEKYRHPTLKILKRRLNENSKQIQELDALLTKEDAPKEDAPKEDGPKEDAKEDAKEDGPKEDGPKEDGPKEDGPKEEEAGPMKTSNPSHWIRSKNTSSGFKGVNKCRGRTGKTWRAKCGGNTIGRYETKAEACQAYYDYCKAHGKLKQKKKKVRDVLEWAS